MTKITDADRLATLEKRVTEMVNLLHFQDSMRVKIEKCIGVIDQQLIKTDAGLNQVRRQMASSAKKKAIKPVAKPKPKPKPKAKPKSKAKSRKK
jgi:hypothetical protein